MRKRGGSGSPERAETFGCSIGRLAGLARFMLFRTKWGGGSLGIGHGV